MIWQIFLVNGVKLRESEKREKENDEVRVPEVNWEKGNFIQAPPSTIFIAFIVIVSLNGFFILCAVYIFCASLLTQSLKMILKTFNRLSCSVLNASAFHLNFWSVEVQKIISTSLAFPEDSHLPSQPHLNLMILNLTYYFHLSRNTFVLFHCSSSYCLFRQLYSSHMYARIQNASLFFRIFNSLRCMLPMLLFFFQEQIQKIH